MEEENNSENIQDLINISPNTTTIGSVTKSISSSTNLEEPLNAKNNLRNNNTNLLPPIVKSNNEPSASKARRNNTLRINTNRNTPRNSNEIVMLRERKALDVSIDAIRSKYNKTGMPSSTHSTPRNANNYEVVSKLNRKLKDMDDYINSLQSKYKLNTTTSTTSAAARKKTATRYKADDRLSYLRRSNSEAENKERESKKRLPPSDHNQPHRSYEKALIPKDETHEKDLLITASSSSEDMTFFDFNDTKNSQNIFRPGEGTPKGDGINKTYTPSPSMRVSRKSEDVLLLVESDCSTVVLKHEDEKVDLLPLVAADDTLAIQDHGNDIELPKILGTEIPKVENIDIANESISDKNESDINNDTSDNHSSMKNNDSSEVTENISVTKEDLVEEISNEIKDDAVNSDEMKKEYHNDNIHEISHNSVGVCDDDTIKVSENPENEQSQQDAEYSNSTTPRIKHHTKKETNYTADALLNNKNNAIQEIQSADSFTTTESKTEEMLIQAIEDKVWTKLYNLQYGNYYEMNNNFVVESKESDEETLNMFNEHLEFLKSSFTPNDDGQKTPEKKIESCANTPTKEYVQDITSSCTTTDYDAKKEIDISTTMSSLSIEHEHIPDNDIEHRYIIKDNESSCDDRYESQDIEDKYDEDDYFSYDHDHKNDILHMSTKSYIGGSTSISSCEEDNVKVQACDEELEIYNIWQEEKDVNKSTKSIPLLPSSTSMVVNIEKSVNYYDNNEQIEIILM